MNLRLISCFGWGKKIKRKSVWVCDRSDGGFVFGGGGGGGVCLSGVILTSMVAFWESGSQFEDVLNAVVPRVKGGGWCVYLGSGWKV